MMNANWMNVCFCGMVDLNGLIIWLLTLLLKEMENQNDYKIVKSKEGKMGSNMGCERRQSIINWK